MSKSILREISRKSLKELINLAASKVNFICNGLYKKTVYQKRFSLAVILASLSFKENEPALLTEVPKLTVQNENNKEFCRNFW